MKEVAEITYQCEICETTYEDKERALKCESRQITQDKGVKIGDKVRVLKGEGEGQIFTVDSIFIANIEWGHYAWETFWHTPVLIAKSGYMSRLLAFDSYLKMEDE